MHENPKTLTTAEALPLVEKLAPELGRALHDRLRAILPLFEQGRASLGRALEAVAPEKRGPDALAAFQTFCVRVNSAAEEHGIGLAVKVDTLKKTEPAQRECWLEGPDPFLQNLAAFSDEATSGLDERTLVEPVGAVSSGEELESTAPPRPLIRFFLSYAHKDGKMVAKLRELLETQLKVSKRYRFEVWSDLQIEVGDGWGAEIKEAIAKCHFGLLLVSPNFLASGFITDEELPHFVNGKHPMLPVGLLPVDFGRMDLQGLERHQIFRLARTGTEDVFFSQCRGPVAFEFAHQLAGRIEARVTKVLADEAAAPGADPRKALPGRRGAEQDALGAAAAEDDDESLEREFETLAHETAQAAVCPTDVVPPEGVTSSLAHWDLAGGLGTNNRTKAVDYLIDWASDPGQAPFAAVLGEVGIGKTTTLMLVARKLNELHRQDPRHPLAIFVDLRDYCREAEPTLENILDEVIRKHWKGPAARSLRSEHIIRAVQERGALIIFDGLDEKIIPLPEQKRLQFIRELWRVLPPEHLKRENKSGRGRMILSCRSHYFPNVIAQNSAFTGEGRDGVRSRDYIACVILPFREEQIRAYLAQVLGEERVEGALELFRSVHNLSELAERPYLLSLICEQIGELERRRSEGRPVQGVTLYELFVEKWLRRDEGKHQFTPEHKLAMMEALAHALWRANARTWTWREVAGWLDRFLLAHPEIRARYPQQTPADAEVLNQDFRTATFFLRPDTEKDGFRFAHTSLQEYFLARHLLAALEQGEIEAWDLPRPSQETLDFLTQLMALLSPEAQAKALGTLERILEDASAPTHARYAALRCWLLGLNTGRPIPAPQRACLDGLDLENWELRGTAERPFDLRGASLVGACLDHAKLQHVLLRGADCSRVSARLVECQLVEADDSVWDQADLTGALWRDSSARVASARETSLHDCDFVRTEERFEGPVDGQPCEVLLRSTPGHRGSLTSARYAPDGQRVVTSSVDCTAKVWDAQSGRCLLTFQGHTRSVLSAAYSPDGRRVVTSSSDGTAKIWDAQSGRCLLTCQGHHRGVNTVSYSPDGSRVVTASADGTAKIWETQSGRCLLTFNGHESWVRSAAYAPDGRSVVTTSADSMVKIWDAQSGRCLLTLRGHQHVLSAAYASDSSRVVTASADRTVKVWDARSGRCLLTLRGHGAEVNSAAFAPSGYLMVTASADGTAKIWDAEYGTCLLVVQEHQRVKSAAYAPDGGRLVTASAAGTAKVWDARSGRCLLTFQTHLGWACFAAYAPHARRVITAGGDGMVKVWDVQSGFLLRFQGQKALVRSAWCAPDGSRVVTACDDGKVKVWDTDSRRCLLTFNGGNGSIYSTAYAPDGSRVVTANGVGTVSVWDAQARRCLLTFKAHEGAVYSIAYAPDCSRVVTASDDGMVKVWDIKSGRCLLTFQGHERGCRSAAYAPDGSRVVTASADGTVKIWDAQSGRCLLRFQGHEGCVNSAAYAPDGSRVATASADGTVKVWDVHSGRCLLTFHGHEGEVRSAAYALDGSQVVTASADGTVKVWDAQNGRCLGTLIFGTDRESAFVDLEKNRILHASPEAWRLLNWQAYDPVQQRRRCLPAEYFGPLPGFEPDAVPVGPPPMEA